MADLANPASTLDRPFDLTTDLAQQWDLSDLYQGFEDPDLGHDLATLQARSRDFRSTYRDRVAQLSAADIAICLRELEALDQIANYLYSYPSLVFAADTRNSQAQQELDRIKAALTQVNNDLLFFNLELQALGLEQFQTLIAAPELANYHHYLEEIAKFSPHRLSEAVEQTRNQDTLTGRQAFIQLRSVHLGEQDYEPVTAPDGKTATSEADLSALLFHGDRDTRYQAYRSVRQVSQTHNTLYAYILSTVARDHALENGMRHHDSTLDKQLLVDEVPASVFWAIMDGTRDRYDLWQRYYHLKGQALGQPIRTCDVYAPWSSTAASPPLRYADGVKTLLAALARFDEGYAQRAEEFFQRRWVDAQVRPGKRGGAFCAYSHGKHSYLLLSYTEDYNSLFTLAHEMGHGLHFAWIDDRQTYFNSNPPMVLAEVASTFNELLLLDYLLENQGDLSPAQSRLLLTRQIEDQLNLLFRQSTISRLELAIHDRAAAGTFDASFVNETWRSLYADLCGDAVEVLPEHQYDWARVGHIFFKPFYCYQYSASNIVSLACYQKYRELGRDFLPGYFDLLAAGGSENQIAALRRHVGVDLTDSATIASALTYVEEVINRLEATL